MSEHEKAKDIMLAHYGLTPEQDYCLEGDTVSKIASAIKEAVAGETERCAKVAEETPLRSPVAIHRDKIAAAIRSGQT